MKAPALLACALLALSTAFAAPIRPNIIFIMADDLGYGDLGCYGQKVIETPRLDRMATEGMRFTQCYAGSPVCAPSRSVLMTGRHTGHTTVRGNMSRHGGVKGLGGAKGRVPLRKEDLTVAEVLKKAGYVTGMAGKWGLGEPGTTGEPKAQGFDEWLGFLNQRRAHNHYPVFLWKDRERLPLPGNKSGEQDYSHDYFTRFALDFVKRHASTASTSSARSRAKPFFLYLPYCVPHDKYQLPPDDLRYADKKWKADEKSHAEMVTRLDRDVGRLLDLLGELGLDDKTVVFFCSDNGAARRWEGRFDSSGSLRGRKRDLTEGGLRTPMIVRWPRIIPAGSVRDEPWWFADVLPTCAELAGAEPPDGHDGRSVVPLLMGTVGVPESERSFYWEFHERGFQQAARIGDWKGILSKPGQALELYDLAKDPGETTDLAAENPEVVEQLLEFIGRSRTPSQEWPIP